MLSAKRDRKAAVRFSRRTLKATHVQKPRVITVDKNAAYLKAMADLKAVQNDLKFGTLLIGNFGTPAWTGSCSRQVDSFLETVVRIGFP
jgi:transposase-like protein